MKNEINLNIYHGVEANVNSYLFTDSNSAILVDALRNSEEAKKLANFVKEKSNKLTHILITHGHADHYIGLSVLKNEFPNAKIVVTKREVKDNIINFSKFMEPIGWLDAEPTMKIKSDKNPNGFDYENNIEVLSNKELRLTNGATLKLNSDYNSAECEHLTTIFSQDLNAFFTGDFCYNKVHPWLAIDRKSMTNWKNQLSAFMTQFSVLNPKIYPGHGAPTDISLFEEVKKYIENFEKTIDNSQSRVQAMEKMKSLYPDYLQADFLLLNSVNAAIKE